VQQVLHGHLYSSTLTVHACIHLFHRGSSCMGGRGRDRRHQHVNARALFCVSSSVGKFWPDFGQTSAGKKMKLKSIRSKRC